MYKQRRIAGRSWSLLAVLPGLLAHAPQAVAQETLAQKIGEDGNPVGSLPREGYEPRGIRSGLLVIGPQLDIGAEYDSNLFADNSGETDDVALVATPQLTFRLDGDIVKWDARAYTTLRRYADISSENSTTFGAQSKFTVRPTDQFTFGGGGQFRREAEDRGDPEARLATAPGPRMFHDLSGNLFARLQGSRLGVQVGGEVRQLDYRSTADAGRDRVEYRGALRGYYLATPITSVYAELFAGRRNYRRSVDDGGIDRDSDTYGANAGVQFDPGGKVRGGAYAGYFRFDPDDPTLRKHSGVEFGANLSYSLSERTYFRLDAFRGDVGTVRAGATGRTDTRLRLGWEQEIRHNLLLNAGVSWRETRFRGLNASSQQKWGGDLELEYLLNRHVGIVATANHIYRNSDEPASDYVRFRGGLALRLRY